MRMSSKEMSFASLFGALAFVSGFISLPLGPVPITMQTLFVLLAGLVLAPRAAVMSQVLHLLLKLLLGGFQSFLSPSFGFLFGFILAAFLLSFWRKQKQGKVSSALLVTAGTLAIYGIGLPYMAFILNGVSGNSFSVTDIFMMGMIMFLPGDFLKAAAAISMARLLVRQMPVPAVKSERK